MKTFPELNYNPFAPKHLKGLSDINSMLRSNYLVINVLKGFSEFFSCVQILKNGEIRYLRMLL
jgi:hypothetical protein